MNEAAFLMRVCVCESARARVFSSLFLGFVFLWAAQGEADFEVVVAAAAVMERDVEREQLSATQK